MKRLTALVLCLVFLFSLCSCKVNKEQPESAPSEAGYNLSQILKEGKIPGTNYALFTLPETIKTENHYGEHVDGEQLHDHEDGNGLFVEEGNRSVKLSLNADCYYYEKGKEDKGISSIVVFNDVLDLLIGTSTSNDVKINFEGIVFEERELTNMQVYFIPYEVEGAKALTFSEGNRKIDFIFMSDILIAINLYDTSVWSLS